MELVAADAEEALAVVAAMVAAVDVLAVEVLQAHGNNLSMRNDVRQVDMVRV